MNKKFAIFDMDGTLVDSMRYWRNLGREYLESKGVREDLTELLEIIRPMTMTESADLFVRTFGLDGTAQSVADEMNEMIKEHYRQDIPRKAGVKKYLEALSEKGVTMCVASATAEELMQACLSRLEIADKFSFLLSCEEVGTGKNRPDVFHAAAKKLGVAPADIAVYEDAFYAVETAKKAGFYVVGVYDDSAASWWEEISLMADETILDWRNEQ